MLPDLPKNARYVKHNNECYDWGTFGWLLLKSGQIKLKQYKYIVLTNSSVRGPYVPAYIPVSLRSRPVHDAICWHTSMSVEQSCHD